MDALQVRVDSIEAEKIVRETYVGIADRVIGAIGDRKKAVVDLTFDLASHASAFCDFAENSKF